MSLSKKIAIVALGVGVAVLATPSIGYSSTSSLPAGTVVKGKLATGTKMIFKGAIDNVAITVTCTAFRSTGKVPSTPKYTVYLESPPKITGCTDSLGGTDTITNNHTNGEWRLAENKTAPYTMALTIPKDGSTFFSSVLPSCVITVAPTAAAPVTGAYNDTTGTVTVTKGPIPVTGSGCSATTATVNATIVLTPNPGAPPF
jgi:hypothetical protein